MDGSPLAFLGTVIFLDIANKGCQQVENHSRDIIWMANECLSASLCGELALGWTSLKWLSPIPFPFCSPRALYCLGDTLWTRGDSSCSEQSCGSTLWASISSGLEAFLASFAPKLCLYQPWKARLSLQSVSTSAWPLQQVLAAFVSRENAGYMFSCSH